MKTLAIFLTICTLFLNACEKVKSRETYYPDKSIKEKWSITTENGNELKNGLYESWYQSGKKQNVFNYVDGKKHGAQKSFYKNGKMKRKEQYMFGILNGKMKKWDKQRNLLNEVIFIDGKKSGKYKSYYPSGNLHKKINYLNDKKNGLQVEYSKNKSLLSAKWFKNGKKMDPPSDSAKIVLKTVKRDTTTAKPKKDQEVDEEEKPVAE